MQPKSKILRIALFVAAWFCLYSGLAQLSNTDLTVSYRAFGEKDGFEVFDVSSMVFDDLGWLWISGINLNTNSKFLNSQPIIQRFDGQSFYTLNLPDFEGAVSPRLFIKKRPDGQMYIHYKLENEARLFLINPNDLIFKEVELPSKMDYKDMYLFLYKDYALVYLRYENDTNLFKLNHENLQFVKLPNKPIENPNPNSSPSLTTLISFEDHFILNDERNEIYSYYEDGSIDRKITHQSIGLDFNDFNEPLRIVTWFKKEGETYVLFNHSNSFYLYEPRTKNWSRSAVLENGNIGRFITNHDDIFNDGLGNFVFQRIRQSGQINSIFLKNTDFKPYRTFESPTYAPSKVASRDLKREFYLEQKGTFHYYSFNTPEVVTFLKDKSIRNLLELNQDEALVATESSGWYIVNLSTKKEQLIDFELLDKPYIPSQNRKIFDDGKFYWSNDSNGIIKVDKQTHKVTSFIHYPIADMVEDERYIYYGTMFYNLMQFDKIKEENTIITSTKDFDVQGILKAGATIYLATTTGLLVYENEHLAHYQNQANQSDSFFLSIAKHHKHGILLGSRSGKVYQFNPATKNFRLFYQDEMNYLDPRVRGIKIT